MSAPAFTSAPWEACAPGDYGDFDGESRVVCGDDMRIAVVHWHPRLNTEECDANAHLIAAAPDLYAAALETVRGFESDRSDIIGRDDDYIYDELGSLLAGAYLAARAALFKAEGK